MNCVRGWYCGRVFKQKKKTNFQVAFWENWPRQAPPEWRGNVLCREREISWRRAWAGSPSAGDYSKASPIKHPSGQKSKEPVRNQPPTAWAALCWEPAFRFLCCDCWEDVWEGRPLPKNLPIFPNAQAAACRQVQRDKSTHPTPRRWVPQERDQVLSVLCTLEQGKHLGYVAWAQGSLASVHRALETQQGLVPSALPHVPGTWKMQIQPCASLALTSRLSPEAYRR